MNCSKCGAPLPAHSRFCNGCGTPVLPPGAQPQQPPAQPGRAYGATPPPGQSPYSGQYRQQPSETPFATPVAAETAKKPVAMLAGAVVVLLAVVGVGAFALTRGRGGGGSSVLGAHSPEIPSGPGVQLAQTPNLPQGPAVTGSQSTPPPTGAPVTGAARKANDMAPPLTMANGMPAPTGPGVTSASSQPPVPGMPSTAAPWQAPPKAPPLTAAPTRPAPAAPPAVAAQAPAPQQPPDNRDLDNYLRWLRFVENQRQLLRGQYMVKMTTLGVAPIEAMLGVIDNENADPQQLLNQRMSGEAREIAAAMVAFRQNIIRSRRGLRVPADCQYIDDNYMGAVANEAALVGPALQCVMFAGSNPQRAMAQLTMIKTQAKNEIYPKLRAADLRMQQVYQARNYDPALQIRLDATSLDQGVGGLGLPGL